MRTLATLAVCAGLALPAFAAPQYVEMKMKITGNSTNTATVNPSGKLMSVLLSAPSTNGTAINTVTGDVRVTVSPNVGYSMPGFILYTNGTAAASAVAHPRFIPTDKTGSALSSLTVAEPYFLCGDPVTLTVIQSGTLTNVLWRVYLKMDK